MGRITLNRRWIVLIATVIQDANKKRFNGIDLYLRVIENLVVELVKQKHDFTVVKFLSSGTMFTEFDRERKDRYH